MMRPSVASVVLSTAQVYDAVALGKPSPVGLKARLPLGGGAGVMGRSPSPQASNSVRPDLPAVAWVRMARSFSTGSIGNLIVVGRRPGGLFTELAPGRGFHVPSLKYSNATFCGGAMPVSSSRK